LPCKPTEHQEGNNLLFSAQKACVRKPYEIHKPSELLHVLRREILKAKGLTKAQPPKLIQGRLFNTSKIKNKLINPFWKTNKPLWKTNKLKKKGNNLKWERSKKGINEVGNQFHSFAGC
jgi:hypothetical protein